MMTPDTLAIFAPCAIHRLWHDLERKCDLCLFEEAAKEPLPDGCDIAPLARPEVEPLIAPKSQHSTVARTIRQEPTPAKPKEPTFFVLGGR